MEWIIQEKICIDEIHRDFDLKLILSFRIFSINSMEYDKKQPTNLK